MAGRGGAAARIAQGALILALCGGWFAAPHARVPLSAAQELPQDDILHDDSKDDPAHGTEERAARHEERPDAAASSTSTSCLVQAGDTLRAIAIREVGDARATHAIWKLNPDLANARELPKGQQLRLPPRDGWYSAGKALLSLRLFDLLDCFGQSRLGVSSAIEIVVALFLALQTVIMIAVAPLALYLGAQLVGAFEARLGHCARVNFKGTMVALVSGLIGWALAGLYFSLGADYSFAALPFEALLRGTLVTVAAVSAAQLATYVFVVRSRLKLGIARAAAATSFVVLLHAALFLAAVPPLIIAALDA